MDNDCRTSENESSIHSDMDGNADTVTGRMSELFDEINECVKGIKNYVEDLQNKFQKKDISTSQGLSLLEVKNQMLLSYLINILYFILHKCNGKSVEGNVVIDHLVEIRIVIERIRPIENKLKYQIDKLLKTASTGKTDVNDPTRYRANPDNLVTISHGDTGIIVDDSDEELDENEHQVDQSTGTDVDAKLKAGIYVPPKLVSVHYDGENTQSYKKERLLERARKRALNSSVVQELQEEYLDVPTEFTQSTGFKPKMSKFAKQKQEYEETYFTRLSTSKKEKNKSKSIYSKGSLDGLTTFEDISALDPSSAFTSLSKKRKSKNLSSKKKGFKNKRKRFN